jgi:predicted Zn-dependent protease
MDFDDKTNKIIITNTKCYSTVEKRAIGGVGELGGNLIIIGKNPANTTERVLIHEMGHCYGLDHCENPTCVMSQTRENDNLKLNFCDDCKKKL